MYRSKNHSNHMAQLKTEHLSGQYDCKYCRSNRKNDGPSIHERKELERMEFGEKDDR